MRILTDENERAILTSYADGKVVLEIGSYDGGSAIAMAQKANAVYCVDPFQEDTAGTEGRIAPSVFQFLKNTEPVANIFLLHGRSIDLLPLLKRSTFGFIFVDGSHHQKAATYDLIMAQRLIIPGGAVAVHDANWPGVRAAIDEVLTDHRGWTQTENYGGRLGVWRCRR